MYNEINSIWSFVGGYLNSWYVCMVNIKLNRKLCNNKCHPMRLPVVRGEGEIPKGVYFLGILSPGGDLTAGRNPWDT